MNNLSISNNQTLTMSSEDLADLLSLRHDNVRKAVKNLESHGVITFTTDLVKGAGRPKQVMHFDKRNSIVVAAKLNDKLMAAVVDRWIELESKQSQPQIPANFAKALQLAADQAKQLELAAPKVAFVDNFVERESLQNATQVSQSMNLKSANALNKILDELGGIYSGAVKRSRVFTVKFINDGYGEIKQTGAGYPQSLFTAKGIVYLNELLTSEGYI